MEIKLEKRDYEAVERFFINLRNLTGVELNYPFSLSITFKGVTQTVVFTARA